MTLTKEREDAIRARLASAECKYASLKGGYVGRCNSSRCPKHGGAAQAARDLLSWLDAEREARQRVERERDLERATCKTIASEVGHLRHVAKLDRDAAERNADAFHAATRRAEKAEHERDEARAERDQERAAIDPAEFERDAIAARYDALREAASAYRAENERASMNAVAYRAACAALAAALADPDGAARERAGRQAERERAIAVAVQSAAMAKSVEAGRSYRDVEALDLDAIIASVRGRL